jgi:tryptophanyl-tRNA synthetase
MVADWHALMSEYENPANLGENILDNVVDWLSCGISPEESAIFIQSQVKEHAELNLVFSIITPLGWLERCPTYKEQLQQVTNRDLSTYGFLGYPVLQAADILLYKAERVPVGEDQLPHLELTREISRRFNGLYQKEVFPQPQALLTKSSRLLGLDGRKMSKSYDNYIVLSEPKEEVRRKAQTMFTDPLRIKRTDLGHPESCNVHSYYAIFAPERAQGIVDLCCRAKIGCTECKQELAEVLIKVLEPIQKKRTELLKDRERIFAILEKGRARASDIAAKTIAEVRSLLNFRID